MSLEKIIIDTDIGDDVDDALAITLAAKSPEINIVGITTVFKNTDARAKIARQLLKLLKREDIPVYAGCGQPLIERVNCDERPCQYFDYMGELEYSKEMDGVDYLINTFENSNGDITLVPIGPLTNVAVALTKRPDIKNKIKRIVLMGGAFYFHYNEWNIKCDPEAARIVFESGIPIDAIGLDVTLKCPLTQEGFEEIKKKNTPLTNLLVDLIMCFYKVKNRLPFLHDPLAVYAAFNRKLLEFQQEEVGVEIKGEYTRGMTFNKCGRDVDRDQIKSGIWVAKGVKSKEFTEMFLNRILS